LKKKQRNCKPSATININNEVPLSLCGLSALVLLFLALTVKSRSTAVQVRQAWAMGAHGDAMTIHCKLEMGAHGEA
jgi:hypothetical protein